jgi:agmatinase
LVKARLPQATIVVAKSKSSDLYYNIALLVADELQRGAGGDSQQRERVLMVPPPPSLPFAGIATFAKLPFQPDLEALDADAVILGAPYDLSTQYRSGTRFGPRAVRVASAIYGMQTVSYYDSEFEETYLDGVSVVDGGDVEMIHASPAICLANIEAAMTTILSRGALPVTIGGDHAIPIPIMRAFGVAGFGPLCVIQLDAHLDFVDERFGVREGHGNVMRRIAEMDHVTALAQIGIRGPGSSGSQDFQDARDMGSVIIGTRAFRRLGIDGVMAQIPDAEQYYVTIDCDAFDPALMPGSGSPSPGGFTYHEVVDFLRGIAARGEVVGFDFVEVAPAYDPAEVTAQTAARVILDFLGVIFHHRAAQTHSERSAHSER